MPTPCIPTTRLSPAQDRHAERAAMSIAGEPRLVSELLKDLARRCGRPEEAITVAAGLASIDRRILRTVGGHRMPVRPLYVFDRGGEPRRVGGSRCPHPAAHHS